MSDAPEPQVDPTESVRTLTSTQFKESYMTRREHQDTDIHYIGDALPMPAMAHMRAGGVVNSVGVSPFPSRADHQHDAGLMWSIMQSPIGFDKPCPPGTTFLNNLQHGGGRNILTTAQVFTFPVNGVYMIFGKYQVTRQGGGNFTNDCMVSGFADNGNHRRNLIKFSVFDISGIFVTQVFDIFYVDSALLVPNYQVAIEHSDAVGWNVKVDHISVFRMSGLISA